MVLICIEETNDILSSQPEIANKLKHEPFHWLEQINAKIPQKYPAYKERT